MNVNALFVVFFLTFVFSASSSIISLFGFYARSFYLVCHCVFGSNVHKYVLGFKL